MKDLSAETMELRDSNVSISYESVSNLLKFCQVEDHWDCLHGRARSADCTLALFRILQIAL